MKSFILNALLGATAVQAVSVESMAQLTAEAMIDTGDIKAGDPFYVRCPYVEYRANRLHVGAHVDIDGLQVASADDKTDDAVDFFFMFEDLGLPNNTLRARLWSPSDADR